MLSLALEGYYGSGGSFALLLLVVPGTLFVSLFLGSTWTS